MGGCETTNFLWGLSLFLASLKFLVKRADYLVTTLFLGNVRFIDPSTSGVPSVFGVNKSLISRSITL